MLSRGHTNERTAGDEKLHLFARALFEKQQGERKRERKRERRDETRAKREA